MTTELLAVLAATLGAVLAGAVAVIAVVVGGQRAIRADIKDAARERADIRDRTSRIEGVIETLQSILLAERLWVRYHSSHEGKASTDVAQVTLS